MSTLEQEIHTIGRRAREASRSLARLTADQKNAILEAMADEILVRTPDILAANTLDTTAAEKAGLTSASIDRLRLTEKRIADMAAGIRQVASLNDPVGEILRC